MNAGVYLSDLIVCCAQTFTSLLNYPLDHAVQLLNASQQVVFNAVLKEPAVPEDPTSNRTDIIMTFNGFAADGDVTAPIVYVNYGTE